MKSTYCEYILEKILSTSEVGPILALIAPSPLISTFLWLGFQIFGFNRTWKRLIQKRVVRNKFDIYVFITTFIYLFIILQFFIYYKIKTKYIFYWRYGKVLRSSSCERLSLNASVVALFVIFFGNWFQSFIVLQKKEKL